MIVAVTGRAGSLGRHAVRFLVERQAQVRVLSRTLAPDPQPTGVAWAVADLDSGAGVTEALAGTDAILHLATDPRHPGADLKQTRLLIERARKAGVKRLVFASIVGIDGMRFGLYRTKLQAEEAVRSSGLQWLIVRSTQFHSLIDRYLRALAELPLPVVLPDNLLFQTIDEEEVGRHMAEVTLGDSDGYGRQLAGPERLTLGAMAAAWEQASGVRTGAMPLAVPERSGDSRLGAHPGSLIEAYRIGLNVPAGQYQAGTVTWQEYLRRDARKQAGARRSRLVASDPADRPERPAKAGRPRSGPAST